MKKSTAFNDTSNLVFDLNENLARILAITGTPPDLNIRTIKSNPGSKSPDAILLFISGLVDTEQVGTFIVEPLNRAFKECNLSGNNSKDLIVNLVHNVITSPSVKVEKSITNIVKILLQGDSILLLDRCDAALAMELRAVEARSVEEPTLETVIRGPKEGFTERLQTGIALIRRKIAHPGLHLEEMCIGRYSQTRVMVVYVNGIVDPDLVNEVKKRLSRIDIDGIMDSGYIEQLIEDAPNSIFPTIGNTEKPDVVAARLLEGRVAVLVDGSPVALTMPRTFYESIQTPEDYYSKPYNYSLLRIIRLIFLISSVALPGLYVAAVNHHPEMIPRSLVITISAAREGVPFPLLLEILFFGLVFEGLREAGVRLPRPVGQAVTIVGALVIGTAAVDAGLVSSSTVIVTAFIGIAGFITPGVYEILLITRLLLLFLAGFLGFLGVTLGLLILFTHMCSLRSFGTPYMSPVSPLNLKELKDVYIRAPLWMLKTRPQFITKNNRVRMGKDQKPSPPDPTARKNK